MLFATVAAVNILNIPALTALVSGIVVVLGRILAGLVVFAIGLFLADLAFNIISSSGNRQAEFWLRSHALPSPGVVWHCNKSGCQQKSSI